MVSLGLLRSPLGGTMFEQQRVSTQHTFIYSQHGRMSRLSTISIYMCVCPQLMHCYLHVLRESLYPYYISGTTSAIYVRPHLSPCRLMTHDKAL